MNEHESTVARRFAALLERGDMAGLRAELVALLGQGGAAGDLRGLDRAALLTRIIPELEPARGTDQPGVHFLPVLDHSLEAVAAADWLLAQVQRAGDGQSAPNLQSAICNLQSTLPAAVRAHPDLRYPSVYSAELARHFAAQVGAGYGRAALFKLAALLHDVAKPQTKQVRPDGTVSFYEHQTVGGEVAAQVARRLRFDEGAVAYVRLVVREHMRPGQLAALDEVTLRAARRFFHATGDAGPDVLVHVLADHMATRGPMLDVRAWYAHVAWVDALLDMVWGEEAELTPPLVNGDDLMRELGVAPGPLLGRLLAAVGEAQAGGEITTRAEALALARKLFTAGASA